MRQVTTPNLRCESACLTALKLVAKAVTPVSGLPVKHSCLHHAIKSLVGVIQREKTPTKFEKVVTTKVAY